MEIFTGFVRICPRDCIHL